MSPKISSLMTQTHARKMLSKTSESGLFHAHKFNDSYFFNLSNLRILYVIFNTKKW